MEEIKVTWARAAQIWWSLVWRGFLVSGLAGLTIGLVAGAIGGILNQPEAVKPWGNIVVILAGIPIGIWVVRTVLTKQYKHYRIALVPSYEAQLQKVVESGNT